jgi:hypothetical protein
VAISWLAASEEAAATAVEMAVSAGATASETDDVTSDAMLETAPREADSTTDEMALVAAPTEADSTTDEMTLVAASGVSWTAEATALVAEAAGSVTSATAD